MSEQTFKTKVVVNKLSDFAIALLLDTPEPGRGLHFHINILGKVYEVPASMWNNLIIDREQGGEFEATFRIVDDQVVEITGA